MIAIEIKGLDKLKKLADDFPAISEKHINRGIARALIRIQDAAKRGAPFGTSGNLRQNWILQMGRFKGSLASGAKANGYPYGTSVEYGTRPHSINVSSNEPFKLWAQRKGLNPYAVANSIKKKGTKANPFFQRAVDEQEEAVDEEFEQIINGIMAEL